MLACILLNLRCRSAAAQDAIMLCILWRLTAVDKHINNSRSNDVPESSEGCRCCSRHSNATNEKGAVVVYSQTRFGGADFKLY